MIQALKQIERPKSLAETAAQYIRRAITKGQFGLGQPISESALTASLGISKTPVREALAQLKMEGLVNIFPQKGTFVFTLSQKEVIDICELRYTLESTALKYAVERNQEDYLFEMERIVARMNDAKESNNEGEYLDLDTDFHALFFQFCGNQYLEDAYRLIAARVEAMRTHLRGMPQHTTKSFLEHGHMLQSIKENDINKSLAILDKHITRTKDSAADHFPKYGI